MTKQEIIYKLQTDGSFAIQFAVDNNLSGVLNILKAKGYVSGNTAEYAKSVLMEMLRYGNVADVKSVFELTPYINNTPNYTAGYIDYFSEKPNAVAQFSRESGSTASFDLNAFLGALGSGLTTYSQQIAVGGTINGLPYNQPIPPKKDYTWLWIVLALVVIVIIGVIIYKRRNK